MVYKKYIKRDGKVFGPYYYESYRDKNGKVKTRYVDSPKKEKTINSKSTLIKNKFFIALFFVALLFLSTFSLFYNQESRATIIEISQRTFSSINYFVTEVLNITFSLLNFSARSIPKNVTPPVRKNTYDFMCLIKTVKKIYFLSNL